MLSIHPYPARRGRLNGLIPLVGAALLIALTGCTEPPADGPARPAATADALLEADRAFAAMAVERGAADAYNVYLAPDAVRLPPGMHPLRSREAIYRSMTKGPAATLSWTPVDAAIAASGDLGYTWGTYEVRMPSDTAAIEYGTYVTVWQPAADTGWSVVVTTSNTSPGPWSP